MFTQVLLLLSLPHSRTLNDIMTPRGSLGSRGEMIKHKQTRYHRNIAAAVSRVTCNVSRVHLCRIIPCSSIVTIVRRGHRVIGHTGHTGHCGGHKTPPDLLLPIVRQMTKTSMTQTLTGVQ